MTKKFKAGRDNIEVRGDFTQTTSISINVFASVITTLGLIGVIIFLVHLLMKAQSECHNHVHPDCVVNLSSHDISCNLQIDKPNNSNFNQTNDEHDESEDNFLFSNKTSVLSYSISDSPYPAIDFIVPFREADYLTRKFSLDSTKFSKTKIDNFTVIKRTNSFNTGLTRAVNTDIEDVTFSLSHQNTVTNDGAVTTLVDSPFSLIRTQNNNTFSIESFLENAEINKTKKVVLPDMSVTDLGVSTLIVEQFPINQETSDTGSDSKSESKSIPENTSPLSLLLLAILGGISVLKQKR